MSTSLAVEASWYPARQASLGGIMTLGLVVEKLWLTG